MTKEEYDKKLWKLLEEKKELKRVEGIYGDVFQNLDYIEEEVEDEKGLQLKFIGCNFLYKGNLDAKTIDSLVSLKRALIATAELLYKYRFFLILLLPFYKKLFRDAIFWFWQLYAVDARKKVYMFNGLYSPVTRELLRVGYKMIDERIPLEGKPLDEDGEPGDEEFRTQVKDVFKCIVSFFQYDSAYYWRLQDFLVILCSEFKQLTDVKKAFEQALSITLAREHHINIKLNSVKNIIKFVLYAPVIRSLIYDFLSQLDCEKIKPDQADTYFNLRREGYDFMGVSLKVRQALADALDKKHDNYICRA